MGLSGLQEHRQKGYLQKRGVSEATSLKNPPQRGSEVTKAVSLELPSNSTDLSHIAYYNLVERGPCKCGLLLEPEHSQEGMCQFCGNNYSTISHCTRSRTPFLSSQVKACLSLSSLLAPGQSDAFSVSLSSTWSSIRKEAAGSCLSTAVLSQQVPPEGALKYLHPGCKYLHSGLPEPPALRLTSFFVSVFPWEIKIERTLGFTVGKGKSTVWRNLRNCGVGKGKYDKHILCSYIKSQNLLKSVK